MQLVDSRVLTEKRGELATCSLGDCHKAFQRREHAILPSDQKPLPSFIGDKKIEVKWFNNTDDERQKAQAKDVGLAGVMNA